ncbi:DUF3857 domain-containing protein [bacterium]|nr:DUF3857 domain-containing protein [bacterium]
MRSPTLSIVVLGAIAAIFAQEVPSPKPLLPFDNANAVVRYDCTAVRINEDGTGESLRHYRVALLTDRAIRQYAQDETVYNLGYDTVEVIAARVHLPDGTVQDVDASSIKDVPLPAFGKFFLQNVREKIITFPALEKGSEIEIQYREITHEAPMDGQFDFSEYFEHTDPVQLKTITIDAPEQMTLHWKTRGEGIAHSETASGDRKLHVWTITDGQQMVPEPGMPPFPEVARQLLVTTVPDWETWSRWYHDLATPEMVADSSIRAEVAELVKGKNRDQAIRAIFQFVSNRIRYVDTALTGRKAGYKPEAAAVTYRNKYGVCRDKAALMVAMLREAGIESDIVLMNPAWKIDHEIPVDQFNHAIVSVRDGGKQIYIDPTVEKTTEYLAANEQDRAVLTCTQEGEELAWTPLQDARDNLYRVNCDSKIAADGNLSANITISTRGLPDLMFRGYMQSISPEERDMLFRSIVQGISPKARMDSLFISDMTDLDTPLEIRLNVTSADYAIRAGEFWLLGSVVLGRRLDFLSSSMLSGSELTERRYPLRLESTFAVQMTETIEIPSGKTVRSLPEAVDVSADEYRLSRRCISKPRQVTVQQTLEVHALDIPLSEYHALLEMVNRMETLDRGKIILTTKS